MFLHAVFTHNAIFANPRQRREASRKDLMAVKTDAEKVAEYEVVVKGLTEKVAALEKPDYSYIHKRLDNEPVMGFMEETDESVNFQVGVGAKGLVDGSYRSMKRHCGRELKGCGYKPWGEFKNFSEFVREGLSNPKGVEDRLARHYDPITKTAKERGLVKAVQGMSESVGSDGGYTVMPEINTKIIDRVYGNNLWSRTDNYVVSGNSMTFMANAETSRANGSRHGGLRGYWVGEGADITKSKPTLREVSLKLVKLGVVVYLTDELIDDKGVALEQYVSRKVGEEFQFMIGDGLVNGTGVGQLLGMLNFPSLISQAAEAGQGADTILPENVVKMVSRFFAPNLPSSLFLHNQDIQPQLDLMGVSVGTGGQLVYMPAGGLSSAPYGTLRGRPMQPTEFNSTLGDVGDLLLADMGQILTISKGGIMQAVSTHIEFLSDQTALRFTMRLNSSPWENAPITPYKGSANTQSNFVTLAAR